MAFDVVAINSGNPINNYASVAYYPCATGVSSGTIYTGRVDNNPTITEIASKWVDRWDNIDPQSPT